MKIIIDGQKVTRVGFDVPAAEEVTRVTDLLKSKYKLGWAGIAALFGMLPTPGNAMNIKKMRVGQKPMPMAHYIVALRLLDEFHIELVNIKHENEDKNGTNYHQRD